MSSESNPSDQPSTATEPLPGIHADGKQATVIGPNDEYELVGDTRINATDYLGLRLPDGREVQVKPAQNLANPNTRDAEPRQRADVIATTAPDRGWHNGRHFYWFRLPGDDTLYGVALTGWTHGIPHETGWSLKYAGPVKCVDKGGWFEYYPA